MWKIFKFKKVKTSNQDDLNPGEPILTLCYVYQAEESRTQELRGTKRAEIGSPWLKCACPNIPAPLMTLQAANGQGTPGFQLGTGDRSFLQVP